MGFLDCRPQRHASCVLSVSGHVAQDATVLNLEYCLAVDSDRPQNFDSTRMRNAAGKASLAETRARIKVALP